MARSERMRRRSSSTCPAAPRSDAISPDWWPRPGDRSFRSGSESSRPAATIDRGSGRNIGASTPAAAKHRQTGAPTKGICNNRTIRVSSRKQLRLPGGRDNYPLVFGFRAPILSHSHCHIEFNNNKARPTPTERGRARRSTGKTVRTDRRRDGRRYAETRPPTPPTTARHCRRQCPRYRARFHSGAAARRSQGQAGRACPSSNRCARSIAPRHRSPPWAWSGIVSTVAAWDAPSVSPSDSRARIAAVKRKSRPGPFS